MSDEPDRVAMRSDLRVLKGDLEKRMGGLEKNMGDIENRLMAKLDASAEETRRHFEETRRHLEETRRHFDVVGEKMRDDFKVVIDKTVALGEKVDRSISGNAVEHAAFVEAIVDHDVRLRVLEKIHGLSKPANS